MSWSRLLSQPLKHRQSHAAYRTRPIHDAADRAPYLTVDGKVYLNFASNDYLGFARHENIIAAWQHGLAHYGAGAGASTHVVGYSHIHAQLEAHLAQWLGYERALVFGSGYAANQALLAALASKNTVLLMDKLCHASLQEAAASSPATVRRFAHLREDVLAKQLAQFAASPMLVLTEGIFSMDGDSPDLAAMRRLCDQHGAWLMVDDAHGLGVCGSQGRGSTDAAGIKADILVVTFGKAAGVAGAAILCQEQVAEYLLQFSRHLIYSTAMPPAQALAVHEAIRQLACADEARERLQNNIDFFRRHFRHSSLQLCPSATAIQPLVCGDNSSVMQAAQKLKQHGLWVGAIRPPAVPSGQARLRITLSAAHQTEHLEKLVLALEEV